MTSTIFVLAFVLFLVIATLYSSVGHAGASGYLAIMAWLSVSTEIIKPTSLILNLFVGTIAAIKYVKEGYFDKKIFFSVVITSIPMAFVGGYTTLNSKYFKLIAGLFLVISGVLLILKAYIRPTQKIKPMPVVWGFVLGAVIGLLSGLVGIGGGVFLSPIIIMAGWTTVKNASGIAALFILCNSITALAGNLAALKKIDTTIIFWIIAVILGGLLGSYLGTKKLNNKLIITMLFLVLISAGIKFLLTLNR